MLDQATAQPVNASTSPKPAARVRPEPSRNKASFKAAHLHALEPIIRAGQDDELCWRASGLFVEPVAGGGAILTATNGSVMASIFDPDAQATARVRLTIPGVIFDRATPPIGVAMWSEGETWRDPLPEWAQPGLVYAYGLACYVLPAMHRPSDDPAWAPMLGYAPLEEGNVYAGGYRVHDIASDKAVFDWRTVFEKERQPGDGRVTLQPCNLGMFDRIAKLFTGTMQFDTAAQGDAVIVTAVGSDRFVGAVMPTRSEISDGPLPAWAVTR